MNDDDVRETSDAPGRPSLVVSLMRQIGFAFLLGGGVMGAAFLTGPLFGTLGDRPVEEAAPVPHGTSPMPGWFWVVMSLLGAGWCLLILSRTLRTLRS